MDPGAYSVAFPRRWWYPVARSSELGRRPLAVTMMDTPLVAFRGAGGRPAVVLDRCSHRNYPLSLGQTTNGDCSSAATTAGASTAAGSAA